MTGFHVGCILKTVLLIFRRSTFTAWGARWRKLQTGRSPVQFPMVSLEFFSDVILPVAL